MKRLLVSFAIFLIAAVNMYADLIPLPADLPSIEALMSLHKTMKSAEDKALNKITLSYVTQTEATKQTIKFNDVKTTLNSKLNNAYSYVVFAGSLSSTTKSLYDLINEYSTFTKAASSTLFKKPMCTWYYVEANFALAREIKNLKAQIATFTASGFNLMRSSMQEKLDMIMYMKTTIEKMRGIINRTYWWCSVVVQEGFKFYYISDILNSDVTDNLAKSIINKWKIG